MENRESLYANIDRKLEVLKQLGALLNSLPELDPTKLPDGAPDEVLSQERELFRNFSQGTLKDTLPEDYQLMVHFQSLGDQVRRGKVNESDIWEFSELKKNKDVSFVWVMQQGAQNACRQREELWTLLTKLGDDWLNPAAYDQFLPASRAAYKGKISAVIPGDFSITLAIDHDTFAELDGKSTIKNGVACEARHFTGTLFNVMDDYPPSVERIDEATPESFAIFLKKMGFRGDKNDFIEELVADTIEHEDNHALICCFSSGNYPKLFLQGIKQNLNDLGTKSFISSIPVVRKETLEALRFNLDSFANIHYDEFVIDFVLSALMRKALLQNLMTCTCQNLMRTNAMELKKFKGRDEQADAMIDTALGYLDFPRLRETVKQLYETVEVKNPERLVDLSAALILFPPTQIRHVQRLVRRWTAS